MKRMFLIILIITMIFQLVSCSKDENEKSDEKVDIENSECFTLTITELGDGYFVAEKPMIQLPTQPKYKVIATLEDDFCVDDDIKVYFDEIVEIDNNYYEITSKLVEPTDIKLEETICYKPVIYLYPTKKEKVFVSIDYNGTLTHTYPIYSNGWNVTAYPNGRLVDDKSNEYPYLFWEGKGNIEYDMSRGFCVSGAETELFLRDKLKFMGLHEKELEDFIEFWVPFMEENSFNKICFQTTAYTENVKLTVFPEPDSILRIFMVFQPLDEFVEIEEQTLTSFQRKGFTLVEWGGSIQY